MIRFAHPIAGTTALLTISVFWLATAASELFGSTDCIVAVKTAIPYGFILLIPALAIAGGTGTVLVRGSRHATVAAKRRRMPIIAANGLLVLVPSALFLAWKAAAGDFDWAFYGVQAVELTAGAINITLMALNLRDGRRLTQVVRTSSAAA